MLIDLKHTLEQGKTAKATLKFEHAGTIDVEFPIAAHRGGRARRSGGQRRHEDGRSRRHDANGQALNAGVITGLAS